MPMPLGYTTRIRLKFTLEARLSLPTLFQISVKVIVLMRWKSFAVVHMFNQNHHTPAY